MRGGRGASREAGGPVWCGGGTTSGMHGARLKAWGPRARAERTLNMSRMSVTLEVSKLSGWLKADAPCRVEGRACDAGAMNEAAAGVPGAEAAAEQLQQAGRRERTRFFDRRSRAGIDLAASAITPARQSLN